ncbi:MAG: hypothetical protein J1F32_01480 [Erysipelotrichales bacterium]|nr:hypothetical protein [Erysipelotrichales bacterium]
MKKSYLLLLVLLLSACSVNNQSDNTDGSNANSVNVPVSTTLPSENSKDSESTSSIPEDSSKNSKSEASNAPSSSLEPSNNQTSTIPPSTKPDDSTSSIPSVDPNELVELGGGEIRGSLPSGWSFIKGPKPETKEQYYSNGGLKFQYVGDGLLSNTFESKNHIEVKINIRALNTKGNLDNVGDNDFSFSLYGLNSSGTVVAADGILRTDSVTVGDYSLLLEGPGITQVKLIYSSSPHDELGNYYNVAFGGISLKGNNSGDDSIKGTEPVNPDKPEEPDKPTTPTEGKLAVPTNLQFDDLHWKITWNSVEHASAYRLMLNDFNIICGNSEYSNVDVILEAILDGIVNTIKVQAIDNYGKYEASDFAIIKYTPGNLTGIYIDENSYVKDLVVEEENGTKVIRIPSNKLSRDSSGGNPDIILATDYDFGSGINQFKFAYEKSDITLLTPEKEGNKISITFAGVGEFMVYVIKNGTTIDDYIYDFIKIIIEPAPITEDFEVYVYEYDYENYEERIYKGSEYTCNYDAVYGFITFLIKCNTEIDVENDFNVLVSLKESDYNGIYYQSATETSEGDFEGYAISLRYGYKGTFTIAFETIDYGGKTITINVI